MAGEVSKLDGMFREAYSQKRLDEARKFNEEGPSMFQLPMAIAEALGWLPRTKAAPRETELVPVAIDAGIFELRQMEVTDLSEYEFSRGELQFEAQTSPNGPSRAGDE